MKDETDFKVIYKAKDREDFQLEQKSEDKILPF